jgi:protein-L-isoaspartate(D-aspartate) O-methyltransferase
MRFDHGQQSERIERRVARLATALELTPDDMVLEIGTGTGLTAAVLAELAHEVFTIERQITLCRLARERLHHLGLGNVHVRCGDGTMGWPEEAPFDAIVVTAGAPTVPQSLRTQLGVGGRLVLVVGDAGSEHLLRVCRTDDLEFAQEDLGAVRFRPLQSAEIWPSDAPRLLPSAASRSHSRFPLGV